MRWWPPITWHPQRLLLAFRGNQSENGDLALGLSFLLSPAAHEGTTRVTPSNLPPGAAVREVPAKPACGSAS